MQAVASQLVGSFVDLTLSLPQTPDELARAVNIERPDPWDVMLLPSQNADRIADPVQPFLSDAIDRLGAANSWQIGPSDSTVPFWSSHSLAAARAALAQRAPGITLVVPADIRDQWDPAILQSAGGALRLAPRIPSDLPSAAVRQAGDYWVAPLAAAPRTISTQFILDGAQPSHTQPAEHAAAIARQLIEVWRMLGSEPEVAASAPLHVALANAWQWPATARQHARPTAASPAPSPHLPAALHGSPSRSPAPKPASRAASSRGTNPAHPMRRFPCPSRAKPC
jgi:hypothetical protein